MSTGRCVLRAKLTRRKEKRGLCTVPPHDIELQVGKGEHMFWPHVHDPMLLSSHVQAFEDFVRHSQGLQEEIQFMEQKGWVTRAIASSTPGRDGGVNAPEIVHVDFHLPWNVKPTTAMKTPRDSLIWRKTRLDASKVSQSAKRDSGQGALDFPSQLSQSMEMCRLTPALSAEIKDHKRRGYRVHARNSQFVQDEKVHSIEGFEYVPEGQVTLRDARRAIPSAMSPKMR